LFLFLYQNNLHHNLPIHRHLIIKHGNDLTDSVCGFKLKVQPGLILSLILEEHIAFKSQVVS